MARSFRLPDLGEGVHEGEVTAVNVKAGQKVSEGDTLLSIETDKAAVDIPSPFTGTVTEVRVRPGDTVKVGAVLVVIETDETATDSEPALPEEKKPTVSAQTQSPGVADKRDAPAGGGHETPVPASPATRRLAREWGVDLRQVTPTGSGGVVTADDVRAFAKDAQPREENPEDAGGRSPRLSGGMMQSVPELPDFSRWGPVERTPFRSIRRATAVQMATAWSQIPHVSSQDSVDVTRLEAFRQAHKAAVVDAGGRLSITVFVIKALAAALKAFPRFNATLDVAGQEIILKHYYHIGVAVNTDSGLIVPVVRDVDRKSITQLAVELKETVEQTRARKISRDDLQGGTFTLTNAGAMGGGFFTPIINFPEVAILGAGQARMQPVVETGESGRHHIAARLMMPLVLCFDHRIADGAEAIGFLNHLMAMLRDPDALLMGI